MNEPNPQSPATPPLPASIPAQGPQPPISVGGQSPPPERLGPIAAQTHFQRELAMVKRRVLDEATSAVAMLEAAIGALWDLNTAAAGEILKRDDRLDQEEVEIEEAVFRLMTLQHPFARDFRLLAFILKVNGDIERVGDHACSIAKIVFKLADQAPAEWPQSLVELGQRVPIACQRLLRALMDEDAELSRSVVVDDKTIDRLTRRLFDETVDFMERHDEAHAAGLLIYRIGRELERVGDLMTNIAEDIIYLRTGEIVRHEKKRMREGLTEPGQQA